jgi:hypothetical protein
MFVTPGALLDVIRLEIFAAPGHRLKHSTIF